MAPSFALLIDRTTQWPAESEFPRSTLTRFLAPRPSRSTAAGAELELTCAPTAGGEKFNHSKIFRLSSKRPMRLSLGQATHDRLRGSSGSLIDVNMRICMAMPAGQPLGLGAGSFACRMPAEQVCTCLHTHEGATADEVSVGLTSPRHDSSQDNLCNSHTHNPHHSTLVHGGGTNPGFTNTHATP